MKRLQISDNGAAVYTLVGPTKDANGADVPAIQHSLDLNAVFGYSGLSPLTQKAVAFAVGHVLRNATAGKMGDDEKAKGFKEASDAIAERVKALAEGKWTAHRETGDAGESKNSLLAQALAVVMGVDAGQAAEFISNEVRTALEEKGIDPDAENDDLTPEQKTERRKIAAQVRKAIGDDAGVSVELQKLKLANAQKALEEKTKEAAGKASAFAKTETATPASA